MDTCVQTNTVNTEERHASNFTNITCSNSLQDNSNALQNHTLSPKRKYLCYYFFNVLMLCTGIFKCYDRSELQKMNIKDLRTICKDNKIVFSQKRKYELIEMILERRLGVTTYSTSQTVHVQSIVQQSNEECPLHIIDMNTDIYQGLMDTWFMKPMSKESRAMQGAKFGSANEINILKAIPTFFEDNEEMVQGWKCVYLREYGLLSRKHEEWIATSPDGFMVLARKQNLFGHNVDSPLHTPVQLYEHMQWETLSVEMKTATTQVRCEEEENIRKRIGQYKELNAEQHQDFHIAVPKVDHRYLFQIIYVTNYV